ncbi:MAG: hypothetical protein QOE24_1952 [Frankiales bacterium]|nr:hypothetical protein [Frankiales bacterium]MDX6209561.1 hypothetical protein [Frankiales bacterium]MDX6223467.1 hypothetical protein [Frankiales bacterium]
MDERSFYAAVAQRVGLSKEEAADLSRATLDTIAGQISDGELERLEVTSPGWLSANLPRHDGAAHPMALTEFVGQVSRRTGLNEDETRRGVAAVLAVMREAADPTHWEHALSLLTKDYRELGSAQRPGSPPKRST